MPGLTQEDVTPVVPQQGTGGGQPKQEGYRWGRWFSNPGNELQWLWNKSGETIQRLNQNVDKTGRVGILKIYTTKDQPNVIRSGALPAQREPVQGAVEATADVVLEAVNLGQNAVEAVRAPLERRAPQPQDVNDTSVGRVLNAVKEKSADLLDVPQRWELDDEDLWARNFGSAGTSALYSAYALSRLGMTPGQQPLAFTGMKVNPFSAPGANQVLSQVKGPWGAYWRKNPKWAQAAARWLSFGGMESFLTTAISDQRDFGYGEPDDDRFRATVKSFIPNAGEELILGGVIAGGAFGTGKVLNKFLDGKSFIAQNNKAWRTVDQVEGARAWAEDNGIQQRTGDGSYEFLAEDPWETGAVTTEQVGSNIDQAAAVQPDAPRNPREAASRMAGDTAEVELEVDPWDPSLPEVDTVIRGIDELDDAALIELGREITEGRNAVEALGEKLNRTQEATPDVPVGPATTSAPDAAIPDADMFASIDLPQLRSIAKIDARVQAELARMGVSPTQASRQEVISAIVTARGKGAATATPAVVPEGALPAVQRNELKTKIVKQAVADGQVRPSATEPPELPTRTTKDPGDMTPEEFIAEENRLAGEYQALENRQAERVQRETRDATGYYEMTPEQQAANGRLDGWTEPEPTPVEPAPATASQEFVLPADLSKSKPRYGYRDRNFEVRFESDLDRAAYVLANDAVKPSKAAPKFRAAIEAAGLDLQEVIAHGRRVKQSLKTQAANAPQGVGLEARNEIVVPRIEFEAAATADAIPQAAIRKITARNQSRVPGKANQLKNWANHGLPPEQHLIRSDQQAETLVNAKGALLDPDKIPGIDLDKAMNDYAMGMKTPETDAVAKAYRDFYGVEGDTPGSSMAMDSAGGDEFVWTNNGLEMQQKLAEVAKQRAVTMRAGLAQIGEQVFGKENLPAGYRFLDDSVVKTKSKEWGGDGTKKSNIFGTYFPEEDVIAINAIATRPWEDLKGTMFHEAWHRIQYGYLNKRELKVLDSVFGKSDLRKLSGIVPESGIKPIEIQAVAFQTYAAARQKGLGRMDLLREAIVAQLEESFPGSAKTMRGRLTTEALTILAEGWERILDFYNRSRNYIDGNGFTNVYDIFEEAWSGRLTANRKFAGFVQVLDELGGLSDEAFNKKLAENPAEMESLYMAAADRRDYWNKWRGLGNNVIDQVDGEISALKQQALEGGC